jgi:hypothetical protein
MGYAGGGVPMMAGGRSWAASLLAAAAMRLKVPRREAMPGRKVEV